MLIANSLPSRTGPPGANFAGSNRWADDVRPDDGWQPTSVSRGSFRDHETRGMQSNTLRQSQAVLIISTVGGMARPAAGRHHEWSSISGVDVDRRRLMLVRGNTSIVFALISTSRVAKDAQTRRQASVALSQLLTCCWNLCRGAKVDIVTDQTSARHLNGYAAGNSQMKTCCLRQSDR